MTDEELLAELGIKPTRSRNRHISRRKVCENFDKSRFDGTLRLLQNGGLKTSLIHTVPKSFVIEQGMWFIIHGQLALVNGATAEARHGFDKKDIRIHVIYSNKTESFVLLNSFKKALRKDSTARYVHAGVKSC